MNRVHNVTNRRCWTILATLLVVALAGSLQTVEAVPVTYFGEDLGLGEATPLASHPNSDMAQAQFLADLHDVGVETLESFAAGTAAPLAVLFGGTANVTATLQGGGAIVAVTPGTTDGYGRYAISGSKYWESAESFSIAFSAPVAAFGFYGVDIGDFQGHVTLQLLNGGAVDLVIPHTVGSPGGTVIYFGFVDYEQQYTGLSFGNTEAGWDFFGFDDFTVGTIANLTQLDIKPTSCPNPFNVRSSGVLPVAILGGPHFDATLVDPMSVRLQGTVPLLRFAYEDVAGWDPGEETCECTTAGPDGYRDMTLKFRIQDVVAELPGPFVEKDVITLTLTGMTMAGTEFEIEDCIVIHGTKGQIEPVIADGEPVSLERADWGSLKNLYR